MQNRARLELVANPEASKEKVKVPEKVDAYIKKVNTLVGFVNTLRQVSSCRATRVKCEQQLRALGVLTEDDDD